MATSKVLLENPRNRDKWVCEDINNIKYINGVGYIAVNRPEEERKVLMRKDSLRVVEHIKEKS